MFIRLLIVDDDEGVIDIIKRFMQPFCSFVDSTDTLEGAKRKAAEGQFNVVLLDLNLRGTGKEDAFRAIREIKSHNCAVVVVSGIADPNLKKDSLAAGADAFVQKGASLDSHNLLLAANLAVLHLPHESFRSSSFTEHIKMLEQVAAA